MSCFVFRKQKAKEAEELEAALQRDYDVIKTTISDVIAQIELGEIEMKIEKQETTRMIEELVSDIVTSVVVDAEARTEKVKADELALLNVVKEKTEPEDEKMEVDNVVCENNLNVEKKSKYPESEKVDPPKPQSEAKYEVVSSPEVIDLASDPPDEEDANVSKEDLDFDILKLAEAAAKEHAADTGGEEVVVSKTGVAPEVEYAAMYPSGNLSVEFPPYITPIPPTSGALPPNTPIELPSYMAAPAPFEPYPHEQLLDDNYYFTLDDLNKMKQVCFLAKII